MNPPTGHFSVFTASGAAAPAEPQSASFDWEHWKGTGTLLVAEDDETVRSFTRRVLEGAGFAVLLANNGKMALEVFAEHEKEIRGVILDVIMPQMDGVEVLRRLRGVSTVPVLLMSGYAEQRFAGSASDLATSGFLQKPFGPADLLAKVSEML